MSSSIEKALVFTLDPPAHIQWNYTKAGVKHVRVSLCPSVCVALCVSFSVSEASLSVALFLCPSLSSFLSLRSCLWPSGAHSLFVTCHLNRIAQSATAHAHRQQHAQLATRPPVFSCTVITSDLTRDEKDTKVQLQLTLVDTIPKTLARSIQKTFAGKHRLCRRQCEAPDPGHQQLSHGTSRTDGRHGAA